MREHARDDSPFREWLSLLSRQRWVVVATVTAATLAALVVSQSEQRLYQGRGNDAQCHAADCLTGKKHGLPAGIPA